MYRLRVESEFDAAHKLEGYEENAAGSMDTRIRWKHFCSRKNRIQSESPLTSEW